jgi:hypothetical protein
VTRLPRRAKDQVRSLAFGLVGFAGLLAVVLGLGACDKLDEAFDCQKICVEFKRCYDDLLDVDVCEDRCFNAIDADSSLDQDADICAACIDNRTCAEVDADCGTCEAVYQTFLR